MKTLIILFHSNNGLNIMLIDQTISLSQILYICLVNYNANDIINNSFAQGI